jgi:proteasome lid subunit RPN8/RPN11
MIETLELTPAHWQSMRDHVAAADPLEGCGLLAGRSTRVEAVLGMRNQAQSAARYVLDPKEQLQAFDWIESQGLELVGIFHSHPSGPETVSPSDVAEAGYEVVQVIWSRPLGEWQARGFWITGGNWVDVALRISP